ncbi:MAG: ABC transporter permease [Oliverpabstia sp.]|nr:ABC transporter permease [Eubacterium sp.]MDY2596346.1 ABC transporter permease [Oliverpabstia sp.]
MEKIKNNAFVKKIGFNRLVLIGVLILMYVAFALLEPTFLKYNRILSALNYAYFLGFLALGVTFVIATGGIDFSIGTVMFCAALIGGQLIVKNGWPVAAAMLVSVGVGMFFGILNGFMVAYMKMPSFITSMASMLLSKGLGSVFTAAQSVSWPQAAQGGWFRNLVKMRVGGMQIPTGLLCLIVVSIICTIILNQTKIGRYILCLGSNKEAVRLSGVNVKKWEFLAFAICGTLAGIAAIFFVGAYSTVQPGLGDTYNNDAIASCVMGGTSMSGGLASIGGTFIGVMIISLLQEGILAMGFQKDWQYVITGLIVIAAVYADVKSRQRRN